MQDLLITCGVACAYQLGRASQVLIFGSKVAPVVVPTSVVVAFEAKFSIGPTIENGGSVGVILVHRADFPDPHLP